MTGFKLYNLNSCPFCVDVRVAAERLGIPLELIDVRREPGARQRLLAWRGRATVPVLVIPGEEGETLMPESRDIIAYLERVVAERAA